MTTTQLHQFLPMILPHAQGCPEPMAEQKLRLAVIEWCERTRCWRHMVNQTIGLTGNAAIVAPGYAAIHKIEWAYFEDQKLTPIQYSEVDHGEDWGASSGIPVWITQSKPDTVSLFPPPSAAGRMKASLFLKPRSGSEYGGNPDDPFEDAFNEVPEFLYTQHAEPLAWGALSRILEIPNQDFTDAAMAQVYRARFVARMDENMGQNMTGQHRAPRRTRYHDF